MKWIELITGFTCNCRCRVCPSFSQAHKPDMTLAEMEHWLRTARSQGALNVWFGGGEPTLVPHLRQAVEAAGSLGYQTIRIQTNALRFAYMPFAQKLVECGANEFFVSLKGADAESHDRMTRHPGSFGLLEQGIRNLVACGAAVGGDILISTESATGLGKMVRSFSSLGIDRFTFWLTSAHGTNDPQATGLVPRMRDLTPHLQAAFEAADEVGATATSWHTPPCVLAEEYRDRYVPARTLDLIVAGPGMTPFMAEDSPMEGGVYLQGCARCRLRPGCLGLRKDYLDLHGDAEFAPIETDP
jgi:MoaA/NifB/PqqE/SkfB family radical SAM enzyme